MLALACLVLGLLVGGALTTLVARVPHDESVRHPGPRCRTCGAAIPARYPVIEAVTGLLFLGTALWLGLSWTLPAGLYLASLTVVATAIDLEHHRLPDVLVLPSYPIMLALLALAMAGPGDLADLGRALLAGGAMFLGYLVLALINPSGMGGGDVKLAGVLGRALGWVGWWPVLVGAFAGFFLGAITGLLLLIGRRAGRKSHIPFGPFMFAGTYVGLLFGEDFGRWYWG